MLVVYMGRGQASLSSSSPQSPPVNFSPLQVGCIKILNAEISGKSSFPVHLIASSIKSELSISGMAIQSF